MTEPEHLILRKLNQILGWQRNADKRLDQLVADVKELTSLFRYIGWTYVERYPENIIRLRSKITSCARRTHERATVL
jgi:hypothetical protein